MDDMKIFAAASYRGKKFYFDENCSDMPSGVKDEVITLCKSAAELVQGVFYVSYDDSDVTFGSRADDGDTDFDEIGARLMTEIIIEEHAELHKSLRLWHALYRTDRGAALREKLKGIL